MSGSSVAEPVAPAPKPEPTLGKRELAIQQLGEAIAANRTPATASVTTGGNAAGDTPATTSTAPAAPVAAPAPTEPLDLSHIPEQYRTHFKSLPADAVKWAKDSLLRQSDYTRKTQALAEERKAFDALKGALLEKAAYWDKTQEDPRKAREILRILEGEARTQPTPGAPNATGVFDYPNATPDAVEKHVVETAEQVAARIVKKHLDDQLFKPLTERRARVQAVNEYAEENGYTTEELTAAIQKADAYSKSTGGSGWEGVTGATAVEWVSPFLVKKAPTTPAAPSGPPVTSPGVAAPSNGSGVVSPEYLPNHLREARMPKNDEERLAHAAWALGRKLGISITPDSIRAMPR